MKKKTKKCKCKLEDFIVKEYIEYRAFVFEKELFAEQIIKHKITSIKCGKCGKKYDVKDFEDIYF